MMLLSIEYVPGREIEAIGLVKGTVVHAEDRIKDIRANLRSIVGGEIGEYTEMLSEARRIATNRMADNATSMGADAVIGVRYGTSAIMGGAAEIIAYGTAVEFKD